ncbi:MAG TPA: T9SS type A sorting domain-containing protein, partial [Paludibacter sp.]|nr:T9SS type A sorting domain-containing protein [Paludibacter sp.]
IDKTLYLSGAINILSGINSKSADIGLKVYPNPAIDVMNILTENQYTNDSYSISDLSGKTVLSGRIMNGSDKINISNLSTGIYTLAYDNKCTRLFKK